MRKQRLLTTILSFLSNRLEPSKLCHLLLEFCVLGLLALPTTSAAAPFKDFFKFTQPNNQEITLFGQGDEFQAVFETTSGYTVVFAPEQKAYFYAKLSSDGKSLLSTGVFAQDPPPEGLKRHLRIDPATARAQARANRDRWDEVMGVSRRWAQLKNLNLGTPMPPDAPTEAPPPFTTTGSIVGLTLLIDFPDEPATISKSDIEEYLNAPSSTLFGNNGSVYQYFKDVSNSRLSYTNVATIYVRMNNPKSYYNNTSVDEGEMGRLLITDALEILKARSDYASTILPTFNTVSTDAGGSIRAFNVFFAGANSGVWSYGLWPHSSSLSYSVDLGNGKVVTRYQISDIGARLALGTFCHENGHMICGFPDIYDYQYDSKGGAGYFSLMGSGASGSFKYNPSQVDAYLKTAAGWANVTDIDITTSLAATLVAAPDGGYNTFYRYRKPGVNTEYYLFENRQRVHRDSLLPGAGIAVWHVDELGDRDNQSIVPNSDHKNYELSLVQADNKYHLQNNANNGDSLDLYYLGNTAAGYTNRLDDSTAPSAHWWDGTGSNLNVNSFGAAGMSMSLDFKSSVYSVCGTVRSGSAAGSPVAGATVSIGGKTAITSTTGTFCIAGLTAGTYLVRIVRSHYQTFTDAAFAVTGDVNDATFVMTLLPTYYLRGTVHSGSSTGPLLKGATVSVGRRSAITDVNGAFTVTCIPPGTYTVTVSKSGYKTLSIPNYTATANTSGVVYSLIPSTYSVSGTVRSGSSTGSLLPGATVAIAGKSAVTNSYGAFTVTGIQAGTYTVTVWKSGYNTLKVPNYTVNGNKSGVAYYLTPAPTYSLSGTVRSGSSTGPILAGAKVSIAGKSVVTNSYGAFTITGILAGTYTVSIAKTGYYNKTVTGFSVSGNRTGVVFYLSPSGSAAALPNIWEALQPSAPET